MIHLECDYFVIGCGASSMAFIDTILTETSYNIIVIDKRDNPGGHWNDAYEFVKLHQPAVYYGINSEKLEKNKNDFSTKKDILEYYKNCMTKFKKTDRLKFYPRCISQFKNNRFYSLEDYIYYTVKVNKKTVDCTYLQVLKPRLETNHAIPPNFLNLVKIKQYEKFVVIGGGKTAIDTCIYLIDNSVKPDNITWIVPNDFWLIRREWLLDKDAKFWKDKPQQESYYKNYLTYWCLKKILFNYLAKFVMLVDEYNNRMTRINRLYMPNKFRGAIVSNEEMIKLRLINNVIRKGRVKKIEGGKILFKDDFINTSLEKNLHINCTGNGLVKKKEIPIFQENKIILQNIIVIQPTFSAAIIGYIEANYPTNFTKNNICEPSSSPTTIEDFILSAIKTRLQLSQWGQDPNFLKWLNNSRLNIWNMWS